MCCMWMRRRRRMDDDGTYLFYGALIKNELFQLSLKSTSIHRKKRDTKSHAWNEWKSRANKSRWTIWIRNCDLWDWISLFELIFQWIYFKRQRAVEANGTNLFFLKIAEILFFWSHNFSHVIPQSITFAKIVLSNNT